VFLLRASCRSTVRRPAGSRGRPSP
jgi:hypothetical protein